MKDTLSPIKRTPTLEIASILDPSIFKTPRNLDNVRTALDRVIGPVSPNNRTVRALLRKVKKVLNEGNV